MKFRIGLSLSFLLFVASLGSAQATAEDYYKLGLESYRIRDYGSALLYFEKTIQVDPKFASAYDFRASLREPRDYQGAIADYTRAIELEPTKKDRHFNRGLMHLYAGESDAAIADFSKEIELGGIKRPCYHFIGQAYEQKASKLIRGRQGRDR